MPSVGNFFAPFFHGETSGLIAKCQLFSQATSLLKKQLTWLPYCSFSQGSKLRLRKRFGFRRLHFKTWSPVGKSSSISVRSLINIAMHLPAVKQISSLRAPANQTPPDKLQARLRMYTFWRMWVCSYYDVRLKRFLTFSLQVSIAG